MKGYARKPMSEREKKRRAKVRAIQEYERTTRINVVSAESGKVFVSITLEDLRVYCLWVDAGSNANVLTVRI